MVTNSPLALFAIDRAGEISVAEGRILDFLDMRCGGSIVAIFHDRPEALKAVDRALCGERINVSLEREGRAFEVHLAPNLLRGDVIGVVGVAADVTERRMLEERLRSQYQQLQELNRLKNDFVNAVSHDLRTPLTTIIGYVEFLEEGLGGALTPEQAEAAGLTVEIELPPTPMILSLDRKRIERVITNLLHNAIKFTPAGGSIRISATQDGDLAHVEIADTGIGIEPQASRSSSTRSSSWKTPLERSADPGWDSPSARPSSRRTAEASGCAALPERGAPSGSRCRSRAPPPGPPTRPRPPPCSFGPKTKDAPAVRPGRPSF